MKKIPLGLMLIFLISMLILVACTSETSAEPETSPPAEETSSTDVAPPEEDTEMESPAVSSDTEVMPTEPNSDNALPLFTLEELAKYNGKNDMPAYVGYEGNVYDVSAIKSWKNGIHQGKYEAGQDLTDVLNNVAPHSPKNLTDNAPIVGILTSD